MKHTKDELYRVGAFDKKILLAPVSSTKDITEDIQLKARHYWISLPHPELGVDIDYCGPLIGLSETPITYRRRAPLIGEHNREIYMGELGVTEQDLKSLYESRVI
jgi:formyl-CoA transferase